MLNLYKMCTHPLPALLNVGFLPLMCRYSILAPNAIPSSGFVEGKDATGKVLAAMELDDDKYKLGHTKVFFR